MIHPLFTVDKSRRLYVFSDVLDFIETVRSIYQKVQYFIRSKFWILPQLHILCTSACSETNYAKNYNSPFTYVSPVSSTSEFTEAKNLPSSSPDLYLVNFLLWRALQQQLYRQDFQVVDHLKHVLLHWWVYSNQDAIKGVPDRLLKER